MYINDIVTEYKVVKNSKDIIERLKVDKLIIWKGNTPLLALQILVRSSTCFGGHPAVYLWFVHSQTVCNRFTKGDVKGGKKGCKKVVGN